MFKNKRVVVCVPSGRYRYLRILLSYLLSERFSDIIDEIQLWLNTDVVTDLEYCANIENTFSKVKCITAPGVLKKDLYDAKRNHWQYNDSIYRFYPVCVDSNTIYVKIDDDICYVHDEFFTNLLNAVLSRQETSYACVCNVYNIPHVMKVLQDRGTIEDMLGHSTGDPRCPHACTDGQYAAYIHKQFLDIQEFGEIESLFFEGHVLKGRQRIGTMAWTGENFQTFNGHVGQRDEVELTTRIPEMLKKPLWMVGDALVCHFAFSHQRAVLEDQTDILQRYLALANKLNNKIL